jgi:hypothetical protein
VSTKYVVETFADIIAAVQEELGADPNDTNVTNRIKRDVNQIYLQEICPDQAWSWLTRRVERQTKAYFSTGTAEVTQGSATVTLTTGPGFSAKGFFFSADGYNEVYRVAQHTASSATVTLESPYTGVSDTVATFKIWTDCIPLPADCESTIKVRHNFRTMPLEAFGDRAYQQLVSTGPRAISRPSCYSTGSLVDPVPFNSVSSLPASTYRSAAGLTRTIVFASTLGADSSTWLLVPGDRIQVSGGGEDSYNGDWVVSEVTTTTATYDTIKFTAKSTLAESSTADTGFTVTKAAQTNLQARYRELLVYPSLYDSVTTLYVDYKISPPPLVEDDDEPLIPLQDRSVLVYGVLSRQWVKHRDAETFATNAALYDRRLAKMAGKIEDSQDLPKIELSKLYTRAKRKGRFDRGFAGPSSSGFATGGGASVIQGTPNRAVIFDANGNLSSDPLVSTTELEYLNGVTSNVQTQLDATALDADLTAHIADTTDAHAGSAITNTPSGNLAATNVQTALDELQTDIDTRATSAALTAHINDTTDAHAGSAITNTPSGNLAATTVQGALNELQTDVDTRLTASSSAALTNKTFDADGTGNSITNIENADIKAAAGIALNKLAATGTSKAAVTDGSGFLVGHASTTATEIGYVNGVTSAIQTQINTKAPAASPTFTGTVTTPLTTAGPVITDGSGVLSSEATLAKTRGGTGQSNASLTFPSSGTVQATTPNNHGVLVSGAGATATVVAPNASTAFPLISGGASADPAWAKLSEAGGGTNQTAYTAGDILYASATNTLSKLAVGTSGQFLKVANGLPSYGPGASGINYLTANPDAETDTTGWTAYADAAGTSPVDGTGGSPTFTWTRSTSSPLRGTGSFLATKDAANRQGEGVAYAITLDSADQAKPICVAFDYAIASGTYADGDLTVYLYDVTNSLVIQPAPYRILSATAGLSQKWIGYFQTSAASTSYRLIIHTASTSASAYTVKFDNFNVGPTYQSYGAVVTDWSSYTPTWSSSSGGPPAIGNGAITGQYRQVGDSLQVQIAINSGTTTTYGGTGYTFSLPSGYTIDTAKLASSTTVNQVLGNATAEVSASLNVYDGQITYLDTTHVRVLNTDGVAEATWGSANPASWAASTANQRMGLFFQVPLAGRSSNVLVSSDADTRVQNFLANGYSSGTVSSTFAGSGNIVFATIEDDTHGAYSSGVVTIPVPGRYKITGHANIPGTYTVNQFATLAINKNGTEVKDFSTYAGGSMSALQAGGEYTANFNAGDTLAMRVYSNATSPSVSNSSVWTFFGVTRVSGPAQIAASETVAARYTNTAGTTLTKSANNTVPFATKDYDTHGAFVTDTFTAPMAGKYSVKAAVYIASGPTWASGDRIAVEILKNGSANSGFVPTIFFGTFAQAVSAAISGTVNCVAGDTIKLNVAPFKAAASNVTLDTSAGYNFIAIERVGN